MFIRVSYMVYLAEILGVWVALDVLASGAELLGLLDDVEDHKQDEKSSHLHRHPPYNTANNDRGDTSTTRFNSSSSKSSDKNQ
eukprot:m.534835 g.534835  ORF g.534835 m.534835 type:complete len:83 (-) comp22059_c0_seq15:146-394(-)